MEKKEDMIEIEKEAYKLYKEIQGSFGRKPLSFEEWQKLNSILN